MTHQSKPPQPSGKGTIDLPDPLPCPPSGRRNRFFVGKRMKAEVFQRDQSYFIGRRRLLNRSVTGWGVVQGFALFNDEGRLDCNCKEPSDAGVLAVGSGLALDRCGREIVLDGPINLGATNIVHLVPCQGGVRPASIATLNPGRYVLSVHYAETPAGTLVAPECGCGAAEAEEICETTIFSLTPIDDCDDCPCLEKDNCSGPGCVCDDACGTEARGPHARLCHWTMEREQRHCGPVPEHCDWPAFDPCDPVPLACVCVEPSEDRCEPLTISVHDPCGPRKIVKGNDLLYDLIAGRDLTKIVDVGWKSLHRLGYCGGDDVPWDVFAALMGAPPEDADDSQDDAAEQREEKPSKAKKVEDPKEEDKAEEDDPGPSVHCPDFRPPTEEGTGGLWIKFDAPVLVETMCPDALVLTAWVIERATGWREGYRVPVQRLVPMSPEETCRGLAAIGFHAELNGRWLRDEIEAGGESRLSTRRSFGFEIMVRGDYLTDCSGQSVDADVRGNALVPSGNGTPGGLSLSSFVVQARPLPQEDMENA